MQEPFIVGWNVTELTDMKNTLHTLRYLPVVVACLWAIGAQAANTLNQASVPAPAGDGWQSLSATVPVAMAPAAKTTGSATDLDVGPPVVLRDPITKASLSPGESVVAVSHAPLALPHVAPTLQPALAAPLANQGMAPFVLHQGEHIQAALDVWLKSQGWHLDWSAGDGTPGHLRDLVSDEDYSLTPKSVDDLLQTLLAGYGLAADVDSSPLIRRVVVRNDNNITD